MNEELSKLYEMMIKLNPDFKLNEETFNNTFDNQQPAQSEFKPKTGDVKMYDKAAKKTTALNKTTSKVNLTTEFGEAFRVWFTKLGYSPQKNAISISKALTEIRKVLIELGYK
jgi:hypothetical protein